MGGRGEGGGGGGERGGGGAITTVHFHYYVSTYHIRTNETDECCCYPANGQVRGEQGTRATSQGNKHGEDSLNQLRTQHDGQTRPKC